MPERFCSRRLPRRLKAGARFPIATRPIGRGRVKPRALSLVLSRPGTIGQQADNSRGRKSRVRRQAGAHRRARRRQTPRKRHTMRPPRRRQSPGVAALQATSANCAAADRWNPARGGGMRWRPATAARSSPTARPLSKGDRRSNRRCHASRSQAAIVRTTANLRPASPQNNWASLAHRALGGHRRCRLRPSREAQARAAARSRRRS